VKENDEIYDLSYLQSYITKALVAMLEEEIESCWEFVISTNDLLCLLFSFSKTWHASLSARHGWLRVLMRFPLRRALASKAFFIITINGNKILASVCVCVCVVGNDPYSTKLTIVYKLFFVKVLLISINECILKQNPYH